jgi:hypothetical protein
VEVPLLRASFFTIITFKLLTFTDMLSLLTVDRLSKSNAAVGSSGVVCAVKSEMFIFVEQLIQ